MATPSYSLQLHISTCSSYNQVPSHQRADVASIAAAARHPAGSCGTLGARPRGRTTRADGSEEAGWWTRSGRAQPAS